MSYAQGGLEANTSGSVVVKNDAFNEIGSNAVAVAGAPAPTVQDNSSHDSGGQLGAFAVESDSIDFALLGGNTASGTGMLAFNVNGTTGTSATLPTGLPWVIGRFESFGGHSGLLDVPAGVTLTIAPGTVIKGDGGSNCSDDMSCALSVEGTLDAVGSSGSPIVFTSVNDNTVGGSTGSGLPVDNDWAGIAFATATTLSDELDHVFFAYASTAVSVGDLNVLAVTNTQFAYDQAAFAVEQTTANDSVLSIVGAAAGDCIPPYTSEIDAITDYFGANGRPGSALDLSSFVGETIPNNSTLQGIYGGVSAIYPLEASIGDDTIPYSMFDCLGVSFPVTPVLIGGGFVMDPAAPITPTLPFSSAFEAIHRES
ncbi:MAG: hypothetical protein ACLP0J_20395 [Solirubrobacteraceae bacterium]